MGKLVVLK